MIIMPLVRPELFRGLTSPPKGLLLFGPPGTGKTLIGKAIANESKSCFFSISSSSLTSKWIGQGEKMVKTLFAVAAYNSPAIVFIDEVDSILTKRSEGENEASRRMKTEILVQLDGAKEGGNVLIIGATNRPGELDDAARRRWERVRSEAKTCGIVLSLISLLLITPFVSSNSSLHSSCLSGLSLRSTSPSLRARDGSR